MSESSPPEPIARIAIVEDDPIVSAHFRDVVASGKNLQIVGVAASVAAGKALAPLKPDLVLLDIGLPDGSGLSLIPVFKAQSETRVLIVTSFGDRETVVRALRAGAEGYLLKDSSAATVLDGICATLAGGAPISPAAAVYLLDSLRGPALGQANEEAVSLTVRETELLKLFARGLSYKEAAKELQISPLTIGNHVKSIYRKLAVNSRGEAVYAALKSGQLDV